MSKLIAILTALVTLTAAADDLTDVRREVVKRHDEAVKRLQDWIARPAIAAEDRGYPEGAEHMAQLARDAGFQQATVIATDGKPGVFAVLDAGAQKTVGLYFMYDVKQFDPAEWTSPPLEAKLVDKPGIGKAIVGRGAVNQKGPESALLAALHAIRGAGRKMPVNLVLVAEGEEEIGSPHIGQLVHRPEVEAALRKCVGVFMPAATQDLDGVVTVSLGAKASSSSSSCRAARSGDAGRRKTFTPRSRRWSTVPRGTSSKRWTRSSPRTGTRSRSKTIRNRGP
jgi:acetylornithine deacetylase/succinyl-diaminopimelate desuccinylase-like protein